jgi:hypothetical protein
MALTMRSAASCMGTTSTFPGVSSNASHATVYIVDLNEKQTKAIADRYSKLAQDSGSRGKMILVLCNGLDHAFGGVLHGDYVNLSRRFFKCESELTLLQCTSSTSTKSKPKQSRTATPSLHKTVAVEAR